LAKEAIEMSKALRVFTVCGSGTVSSALLGSRVKEILEDEGIDVKITETSVREVRACVESGLVDMIVTSSALSDKVSVPVIKGLAFLTGIGAEECTQEVIDTAKKIGEAAK
jgi:PTS system galactitol-specific IIB component